MLGHVFEALLLERLHSRKRFEALMAHVELRERLMIEVHEHPARADLVQLVRDHLHKLGLIQPRVQEHILPLLDVDAHAGNQPGIPAKSCFLHASPPSRPEGRLPGYYTIRTAVHQHKPEGCRSLAGKTLRTPRFSAANPDFATHCPSLCMQNARKRRNFQKSLVFSEKLW